MMLVVSFIYFYLYAVAAGPCTYTASDGSQYDLAPMAHASGEQDYSGTDAVGYQYYWNICGNTVSSQCGVTSAVCQYTGSLKYSCGLLPGRFYDYEDGPANQGLNLVYSNGTAAPACFPRSTFVYLKCNPNAGRGNVIKITEGKTRCSYAIYMESAYACPKGTKFHIYQFSRCSSGKPFLKVPPPHALILPPMAPNMTCPQ